MSPEQLCNTMTDESLRLEHLANELAHTETLIVERRRAVKEAEFELANLKVNLAETILIDKVGEKLSVDQRKAVLEQGYRSNVDYQQAEHAVVHADHMLETAKGIKAGLLERSKALNVRLNCLRSAAEVVAADITNESCSKRLEAARLAMGGARPPLSAGGVRRP